MPAPTIQYSPEQEKIFQAQDGGYIVVANAGTGKTTSTAELIVRCYENEERKRFGSKGRATGAQQIRLLDQFRCVTFTVKAAASLDEKIKELLVYNELSVSEIAYRLSYSSVAHLSAQFKKITGLSPSHFKTVKEKKRKSLDRVIPDINKTNKNINSKTTNGSNFVSGII